MKGTIRAVVWVGALVFLAVWILPGVIGAIRGKWEARNEWASGKATIYVSGLRRGFYNVDAETGLPVKEIAGCVVNDEIEGREDGHNSAIRADVAWYGLPPYSWLVREPGVCEIRNTWQRREKAGEVVVRGDAGGVVHVLPGVEIRESLGYQDEKRMSFWIDGEEMMRDLPGHEAVEAMPGEKAKDVVYVRWKDDKGAWEYGAVDVAAKRWLRLERAWGL